MHILRSKRAVQLYSCLAITCCCHIATFAQTDPSDIEVIETETTTTTAPPLDDFTTRQTIAEHQVLQYAPTREADILWEKRLWRVLDVREKRNLSFVYPVDPFFKILSDAALSGQLTVYNTEDDQFKHALTQADLRSVLYGIDTVSTLVGENFDTEQIQIVENELNWENVKRFRLKEVWWFDTRTSSLRHRILGIAPMVNEYDENGNFRYERPLFWVHYPSARKLLAQHQVIMSGDNMSTAMTWEDFFEQRRFSSYISKESSILDRRLSDYLTGSDLLLASQQIQDDLFNREQDLWSW